MIRRHICKVFYLLLLITSSIYADEMTGKKGATESRPDQIWKQLTQEQKKEVILHYYQLKTQNKQLPQKLHINIMTFFPFAF